MYPIARSLLIMLTIIGYLLAVSAPFVCVVSVMMAMSQKEPPESRAQGTLFAIIAAGVFVGSIMMLVCCDLARAILDTARNTDLMVKLLSKQEVQRGGSEGRNPS
jgi:NADH:ubiquinone oxidoreductase subunit 6 (subunit J)